MRVLITGGCGFIGCNLADYFLKQGHEVIVADNLSRPGVEKNLDWLKQNHPNLNFVYSDTRRFDDMRNLVKDVDTIFHTAAQVAVTTSLMNPRDDFDTNILGTFNLLEAVRQSNTNPIVFFTSTNKVYGNNVNRIPIIEKEKRYEFTDLASLLSRRYTLGIPEDFPADANEHTPYGSSKYAADVYMRDFAAVFGLRTVTFRMSCIYGTRQFGNEEQGWVAHFVISSLLGRPITIYGDGKQVRDALFVEDLVKAFDLAMQHINKTREKVYNIGGGTQNTISLLELIELLENMNKKKIPLTFKNWRPFDQKVYISDIRKAKEFNWEPKVSVNNGIQRLRDWVQQNINLFK